MDASESLCKKVSKMYFKNSVNEGDYSNDPNREKGKPGGEMGKLGLKALVVRRIYMLLKERKKV